MQTGARLEIVRGRSSRSRGGFRRRFSVVAGLGASLLAPPARAGADCSAAVVLDGSTEAVAAVREAFARRGEDAGPKPGCEPVRARVEKRDGALVVWIRDAGGRASERTVAAASTAADLIESWAGAAALPAGALAAFAPAAPVRPVRPIADDDGETAPLALRAAFAEPARPAFTIAATGETTTGNDGSLWFGASAVGCVRFGPACIGVTARVASDARLRGASARLDTARLAADLLVGADVAWRRGRFALRPGAGVGFGWLHIGQAHPGVDELDLDSGGLRADLHLIVSVRVAGKLWLDAAVAVAAAPLAHTAPFQQDRVTLAGEPWGYLRGGLGLRYGEP